MSPSMELRVLSGRHSGARAMVRGGERIGVGDDCDLVLSDFQFGEDVVAWLQLRAGRWSLTSEQPQATDSEDALDAPTGGNPLGGIAVLGDVALTVCAPELPWQRLPAQGPTASAQSLQLAESGDASTPTDTPREVRKQVTAQAKPVAKTPATAATAAQTETKTKTKTEPTRWGARIKPVWIIAIALLLLLIGVLWSVLMKAQSSSTDVLTEQAQHAPDRAKQQQLVRDAQLAIAAVDPALRLQVDELPAGGIAVSGWVANVTQLDRLAEQLSTLRPLPKLSLRAASEATDDLRDAASTAGIIKPSFELLGSGRIKIKGLVLDAAAHDKAMQTLRASLPKNLEMDDGLRVAALQGPALQEWLRASGFPNAKTQWNASTGRMQITLPLEVQERPRFENLLAKTDVPLVDIPFTLNVLDVVPSESKVARSAPAPALTHVSAAPLPFRIRSVVGGVTPYAILDDGSKLQPGGKRGAWTLDSVDGDRITFSGPKTLVLAR